MEFKCRCFIGKVCSVCILNWGSLKWADTYWSSSTTATFCSIAWYFSLPVNDKNCVNMYNKKTAWWCIILKWWEYIVSSFQTNRPQRPEFYWWTNSEMYNWTSVCDNVRLYMRRTRTGLLLKSMVGGCWCLLVLVAVLLLFAVCIADVCHRGGEVYSAVAGVCCRAVDVCLFVRSLNVFEFLRRLPYGAPWIPTRANKTSSCLLKNLQGHSFKLICHSKTQIFNQL